jgi:hypothetical protein
MFKLQKDILSLSREIQDKLANLKKESPPRYTEWENLFDECVKKKTYYETLLTKSQSPKITDSEYITAVTLLTKKETDILELEKDLLHRLNEPANTSDVDRALQKAKALSGQGNVAIRPAVAKAALIRKQRQKK